jgi:hypothetical protein
MHVVEPWDLWQRYTEPAYLDQAPRPVGDPNLPVDLRLEFAGHMHTRNNAYNDASHETYIKRRQKSAPRFTEYAAQGFDAASQLKAMDVEGIDQAVLFPTKGLLVPWVDGIDPGGVSCVQQLAWRLLCSEPRATEGRGSSDAARPRVGDNRSKADCAGHGYVSGLDAPQPNQRQAVARPRI